ncbi:hypothetical protein HPB52_018003 [Rhipicephalus sanguineus]|uniref:CCHC-type domain-containing protein n=1 Tax=Rhipicephalus sanguineus TaxID=34632 RepID=A0A9D4Q2H0_RHISA|nr:hypothetical protein HPB52_018003 [Rhipicephalus sanguineus]
MSQSTIQTNDPGVVSPWGPQETDAFLEKSPAAGATSATETSPRDGDRGRTEQHRESNHIQDQQEGISISSSSSEVPAGNHPHQEQQQSQQRTERASRQSPKRVLRADDETERRHAPGRRRHFRSESCSPEVLNRSSNVTSSGTIGSSSNNQRDDDTTTFKSPTRSLMDSRVGFVVPMRPRTRSNPKPPPNRTSREFDAVTEVDQTTTSPAAVRQPSFAASNKSSSLESPSRGHPQQTKTTSRSLEEKMSTSSSLPLQQTMTAPLVSPPPDPATARLAQEVIGKDHKILSSKEREVMLREITGQTAGSFSALEEPVPAPRPTTLRQRRLMFSHLTASVDVDTREKPSTPPCLTAALAGSEDMLLSEVFNNSQLASSLEQLTGVARKTLRKRALVQPLQACTTAPAGYDIAAGQPYLPTNVTQPWSAAIPGESITTQPSLVSAPVREQRQDAVPTCISDAQHHRRDAASNLELKALTESIKSLADRLKSVEDEVCRPPAQWPPRTSRGGDGRPRCYYCHRLGHIARQCHRQYEDQQRQRREEQSGNGERHFDSGNGNGQA